MTQSNGIISWRLLQEYIALAQTNAQDDLSLHAKCGFSSWRWFLDCDCINFMFQQMYIALLLSVEDSAEPKPAFATHAGALLSHVGI